MKAKISIILLLMASISAHAEWTRSLYSYEGMIIMSFKKDGAPMWKVHLGAGGSITEIIDLQDRYQRISATPINEYDAINGRVTQEVDWITSLDNPDASGDGRYNINQGGAADGLMSQVVNVEWDQSSYWVRIDSVSDYNWREENRPYYSGSKISYRVEYQMLSDGTLDVRRYVYFGTPYVNGEAQTGAHTIYHEAWTPLANSTSTFDAAAVALSETGEPTYWWLYTNMPSYPKLDLKNGFFTVFDNDYRTSKPAFSVVYGTKLPGNNSDYRLNMLPRFGSITPMMCAMPAIYVYDAYPGVMIDRTIKLVYGPDGLTSAYRDQLTSSASLLQAPSIMRSNEGWPYGVLENNINKSGARTADLADLL